MTGVQTCALPICTPQQKGHHIGESFAHGGLVQHHEPVKQIPAKNTQRLTDGIAKISGAFQDHALSLGMAKGRIHNYLNSIRPQKMQQKLPFDAVMQDPDKQRNYDHAVRVALSPLHVLDKIKQGSLTSEDVNHLDRKSTRLNSSHMSESRMPSSA